MSLFMPLLAEIKIILVCPLIDNKKEPIIMQEISQLL